MTPHHHDHLNTLELSQMFTALEASDNVSYILSSELRILLTNAAWARFAKQNGGKNFVERWRGASLYEVIPEVLRPFYQHGFAQARDTGQRWEHDYECNSPMQFRQYRMIAYPFKSSFVVTHALLVERPHEDVTAQPSRDYEHRGMLMMCAHCRRVRHGTSTDRWDWIPSYVATRLTNVSHGLCLPCSEYYYR